MRSITLNRRIRLNGVVCSLLALTLLGATSQYLAHFHVPRATSSHAAQLDVHGHATTGALQPVPAVRPAAGAAGARIDAGHTILRRRHPRGGGARPAGARCATALAACPRSPVPDLLNVKSAPATLWPGARSLNRRFQVYRELPCISVSYGERPVAIFLIPSLAAAEDPPRPKDSLQEVVVTATALRESSLEVAQPTAVLAGDDLVRARSTSIGEALAGTPGVSATYFGPQASRPVIRGQTGERVQVSEDGAESLDVAALSADHAVTIDPLLADRVEVLRGPGDAVVWQWRIRRAGQRAGAARPRAGVPRHGGRRGRAARLERAGRARRSAASRRRRRRLVVSW